MGINITEHERKGVCTLNEEQDSSEFERFRAIIPPSFPNKRGKNLPCYNVHVLSKSVELEANYYIGIDWLIKSERYVYVSPKINRKIVNAFEKKSNELEAIDTSLNLNEDKEVLGGEIRELDYLKMFMYSVAHPTIVEHTDKLMFIDWDAKEINIPQKQDILTPFLVVQFLNLLKRIVRKGLKKSYYKVRKNLKSRVKGKILVSEHLKRNIFKNRNTQIYCEYQEFDIDNMENRFLKKVLHFIKHYLTSDNTGFKEKRTAIEGLLSYCLLPFELVSDSIDESELKHLKTSIFFKEYKQAIKIGKFILKRFAYNISNTTKLEIATPPFWIDMPRLFELYTYYHLLKIFNPNEIEYHFSTYGNELDFLIKKEGFKMVVDAKYKLHYKSGHIHSDIRQVSGYARLNEVYRDLDMEGSTQLINCLIIYPTNEELTEAYKMNILLDESSLIPAYNNIYKIGIPMPYIK